jgi:hypothetical protein
MTIKGFGGLVWELLTLNEMMGLLWTHFHSSWRTRIGQAKVCPLPAPEGDGVAITPAGAVSFTAA